MNYKIDEKSNKLIVKGIMNGFEAYLNERKLKNEELEISGAFAWTRGNFIDDAIAKECKLNGMKFNKRTAGYSWEYLDYEVEDTNEKYLVVVKSPAFKKEYQKENKSFPKNYINQMSESINGDLVESEDFKKFVGKSENYTLEVGLPFKQSKLNLAQNEYSRFYIIVYDFNVEKNISEIASYIPSSDGTLYKIEDLTKHIEDSGVIITDDLLDALNIDENITYPVETGLPGADIFEFNIEADKK